MEQKGCMPDFWNGRLNYSPTGGCTANPIWLTANNQRKQPDFACIPKHNILLQIMHYTTRIIVLRNWHIFGMLRQPVTPPCSQEWSGARWDQGYYWPIGSRTRAFDWCQNQRPWMPRNGHFALCFKTRASFGAHHENLNEDRPILSATKM